MSSAHIEFSSASFAPAQKTAVRPIWRDLLELLVGYGFIVAVIWTSGAVQRWLYWAALVAIVGITILSFDGARETGFRPPDGWRSLWVVAVALIVTAIAVTVASHLHTLHGPRTPIHLVRRFWGYSIFAFVQQFLLQDYVLLRLKRMLPTASLAVVVAAGSFMIAHIPSVVLMPLTLVWGIAACALFLRYRNLYTLAIAHAILGICIAVCVPGNVDHNMRVGIGYSTFHPKPPQLPKPQRPH